MENVCPDQQVFLQAEKESLLFALQYLISSSLSTFIFPYLNCIYIFTILGTNDDLKMM